MAALPTTFSLQPGLHCFMLTVTPVHLHLDLLGWCPFLCDFGYQDEISIKIKHNLLAGGEWSLKRALEN